MPSESQVLDHVFQSLSNRTRREVVERLSVGPATMSELAAPFDMALPSFLQHLRVLEGSGLVRSQKAGRVRTFRISPPPIVLAESWLDVRRRQWNARLDQFDDLLNSLTEDPTHE